MKHPRSKRNQGVIIMLRHVICFALGLTITSSLYAPSCHAETAPGGKTKKPLKIYLLAGQSNMQGKAQDFTIARMALSPETKELHDKLVDETGEPRVHENVSVVYFTLGDTKRGEYRPLRVAEGKLSTGFGENFGPELGFGVTVDAAHDEPILIIKGAWGGKSLRRDFRPPSAGFSPEDPMASYYVKKLPAEEKKKALAEMEKTGAPYYKLMMELFKKALADPGKYCDVYDPEVGYEIAGFGWFQGFNDLKEPQGYTELMAHFIRDVRKDLDVPNMPFVIGVIGTGGEANTKENAVTLRKEMAATADIPEFKGNVKAVNTAQFWDTEMEAAMERASKANNMMVDAEEWSIVGQPEPSERIWRYTTFNPPEGSGTHRKMEGIRGGMTLIEPPGDLKDWLDPEFDTSSWKQGQAPVGKYEGTPPAKSRVDKRGRKTLSKDELDATLRSPWGDGELLLMKTTFTCDAEFDILRVWTSFTGSHVVYLNGEVIRNFPWFNKYYEGEPRRSDILIDGKLVKKGVNELAIYGNVSRKNPAKISVLDSYLEGLPRAAADRIKQAQEEFYTERDRKLVKGKSNQAYHYYGSAYTYCQIGEAMAEAVLELQSKE